MITYNQILERYGNHAAEDMKEAVQKYRKLGLLYEIPAGDNHAFLFFAGRDENGRDGTFYYRTLKETGRFVRKPLIDAMVQVLKENRPKTHGAITEHIITSDYTRKDLEDKLIAWKNERDQYLMENGVKDIFRDMESYITDLYKELQDLRGRVGNMQEPLEDK